MASKHKKDDLGAGLRVSSQNIEPHPAGPPRHGELTQAERAFTLASTFLSGVLAISASQFLGAPLKLIDPAFYDGYMAYTKECFAILITCLTQWWAPTVVRVSGDESMKGELVQMKDGSLKCNFAERMVLMANHQLYTDWLYLWWIAYTNDLHGFVYIILKESLKHIPIVGWGCQFYNFIFLARNWEEDQHRFKKHLSQLNKSANPMWLIIFPEGTNLAQTTREKSAAWAKKNGLKDMKHQLLPRSTGLKFCLQELHETTEWLYDCTIAYEGVPPGQFGQDIFTLRSSFFEGRPPKSVNMHWRKFRIDSIPINSPKAFEVWLRNRWREKDYMLEYFQHNNRFPADDFWKPHLDTSDSGSSVSRQTIRSVPRAARVIETEVKSGNWNEFVKIFAPITSVMMALTVAYGASPNDLPIPGGSDIFEKLMKGMLSGDMQGLPSPDELEKMIVGAAKMGAEKETDDEPKEQTKVQKLTQENLARLVKETAIQNGMVLSAGKRRPAASYAPPAPQITPSTRPAISSVPKAKSGIINKPPPVRQPPAKLVQPAGRPQSVTAAPTKSPLRPKQKTPSDGTTQTVFTKTGVAIKIPKPQVEEAKKTGTIVTKSGLVIRVGKDEIAEAQKKKGATVMTASGVPIKINPSGAITVQPKASAELTTPVKKSGGMANSASTAPRAVARPQPQTKGPTALSPAPKNRTVPSAKVHVTGKTATSKAAPRVSGALPA